MKIQKDFKNGLMKRRELELLVESEKAPNFADMQKEVAKELGAYEDLVVVKAIRGSFGSHEFLIEIFVYHSPEDKVWAEPKKKVKKKEGAAPAAAKK